MNKNRLFLFLILNILLITARLFSDTGLTIDSSAGGSINHSISFYQVSRILIWTGSTVLIILLCLVAFLFINLKRYKKLEKTLRTKNRDLEQKIHNCTFEYNTAVENAEEANSVKSDFLANISHEIRTPMNAILGLSYLIQETELNDKQKDYVQKILKAGNSLLKIIDDILDFSRIETGIVKISHTDFKLDDVINSLEDRIRPEAENKGLKLRLYVSPQIPPALNGDNLKLNKVLMHIASNAVKFTERGEILVSAEFAGINSDHADIKFTFKDTGIGINPEQQQKLFTPFSQADTSATRKYGGTGLGLAISKRLVAMMGGTIEVDSTPEEGSRFFFTLPFKFAENQPATTSVPVKLPHDNAFSESNDKPAALGYEFTGKRVLIAEDNKINQQVAKEMIENMQLKVDIAENGKLAVEMLEESTKQNRPYDLIFMDIQMPVMNGYDSAAEIRKKNKNIPIIAMTANTMTGDREKAFKSGMNDYVSKPVDPEKLARAIVRQIGEPDRIAEYRHKKDAESILSGNTANFDTEAAVARLGGNKELYLELLNAFITEYKNTAADFQKLIKEKNNEEARRIVHTIKGVSGNLGMQALHIAAIELEKAVKEKKTGDITALFSRFENELTSALNTVRAAGIENKSKHENHEQKTFNSELAAEQLTEFIRYAQNRQPKPANETINKLYESDWPENCSSLFKEVVILTKHYKLKEAALKAAVIIEKIAEEST